MKPFLRVVDPMFGTEMLFTVYATSGVRVDLSSAPLMLRTVHRHHSAQQSRNKFVETALEFALTYAAMLANGGVGSALITIMADSDYYSHGDSYGGTGGSQESRFIDFHVPLHKAHKTGLGSSAALVTAFTAAVMAYYVPSKILDLTSSQGRHVLHNLAQAAHCAAQGKVGSGFDVAAATFGSCVYRRFSPSILEGTANVGSKGFASGLMKTVENTEAAKKWDTEIDKAPAVLPKGLVLLMCDVDCGSETVGMVKYVLTWRSSNKQEADLLWATLQQGNEDLARELQKLSSVAAESGPDYENLRNIILTNRSLIREMSEKAKVPIEPKVSTDLIDRCCQVSGVIGGVVPGAGGFDAIALLAQDSQDTLEELKKVLESYRVEFISGDAGKSIGRVRLLGVKQDDQGLRQERADDYLQWVH